MEKALLGGAEGASQDKLIGPIALAVQLILLGYFYKCEFVVDGEMNGVGLGSIYNFYVGVALMMFVGFGYLMTFLKSYGLGAVGYTMMITCVGVQVAILCEVAFTAGFAFPLKVGMMSFMNGNFAVAAVLISFGGLIGKLSPTQALILTVIELKCYCANKVYFLTNQMEIADCGGTIIIHVFGAYFGLAACKALGPAKESNLNGSSYTSDLFSLVGTVFLWLYWPSFVAGGLTDATEQNYAIMNTVLALLASTVTTFAITPLLSGNKLATVPIQNATLAGGVSIGATANLIHGPFGAVLVGIIAGAISCVGFCKPLISAEYDTCGINNLHGMPGIFGGLVSVVLPLLKVGTADPAKQMYGLVGTLVVAIITGFITGKILACFGTPDATPSYSDDTFWDCADDLKKE